MVLVLMIVPALLAMQADVSNQIAAMRRALARPRQAGFVGAVTVLGAFGVAALFVATLGGYIIGDAPLVALPLEGVTGAALAFLAAAAILLFGLFLGSAVVRATTKRN
jgi:hypothetical protein